MKETTILQLGGEGGSIKLFKKNNHFVFTSNEAWATSLKN